MHGRRRLFTLIIADALPTAVCPTGIDWTPSPLLLLLLHNLFYYFLSQFSFFFIRAIIPRVKNSTVRYRRLEAGCIVHQASCTELKKEKKSVDEIEAKPKDVGHVSPGN